MEQISKFSAAIRNQRDTVLRFQLLDERLLKQAKHNPFVTCNDLKHIIQTNNPFVERVFEIFKDKEGRVSVGAYLDNVRKITRAATREKLHFLFNVYDSGSDGLLSFTELREVIKCCMQENGLFFSEDEIDRMTQVLMEDAGGCSPYRTEASTFQGTRTGALASEENKGISFDQFMQLFKRSPGLMENVARSLDQLLLPPLSQSKSVRIDPFRKLRWTYVWRNASSYLFIVTFSMTCILLTCLRFWQYRPKVRGKETLIDEETIFVQVARSGGICLNFTTSLMLIFVLRRCITFLRSHRFSSFLPLDHNIYFHKVVGYFIATFSLIHILAHGLNYRRLDREGKLSTTFVVQYFGVQERYPGNPWFDGKDDWLLRAYCQVFGWTLLIILILMIATSLPFVRESGWFEVFFYFHLFYIAFYIILLLHAVRYWRWFMIPGSLFVMEGIIRLYRSFGSRGYTHVSQGIILPSKVVHLIIKRPVNFNYHPGDWVFLQIPRIARMEWHPFTISSAPETPEHIWLHIRRAGEWTNRVYDYVQQQENDMREMEERQKEGARSRTQTTGSSLRSLLTRMKATSNASPYTSLAEESDTPNSVEPTPSISKRDSKNTVKEQIEKVSRMAERSNLQSVQGLEKKASFRLSFDKNNSKMYVLPAPDEDELSSSSFVGILRRQTQRRKEAPRCPSRIEGAEDGSCSMISESEVIRAVQGLPDPEKVLRSGRVIGVEKPLVVHIDGPYGSPTSTLFHTDHAVLIGAGIGVTPFASILQSIMLRYIQAKNTCPNCQHTWCDRIPPNVMNLKKVDFVWLNRDQKCFEWFVNLLSELELEQAMLKNNGEDRFLDIHTYVTSALDRCDMRAVGLQLALDLMYEKEERDLITGLRTRSRAGRPDWETLFAGFKAQQKGQVTVFFCGPPALGRVIQSQCVAIGFGFKKENF